METCSGFKMLDKGLYIIAFAKLYKFGELNHTIPAGFFSFACLYGFSVAFKHQRSYRDGACL